jgi:hypothetical protein
MARISRIYLIGNGASIPNGSPYSKNLLIKSFFIFCNTQDSNEKARFKECFQSLFSMMQKIDCKEKWKQYKKKLENYSICNDVEKNEIENELSKLYIWDILVQIKDYWNSQNYIPWFHDEQNKKIIIRKEYNDIGWLTVLTIYKSLKNKTSQIYKNFIAKISKIKQDNFIIINLNYDNLLENEVWPNLKQNKNLFINGFAQKDNITIYKPHGGFDFILCKKCNKISYRQNFNIFSIRHNGLRKCLYCGIPHNWNYFIPYTDVEFEKQLAEFEKNQQANAQQNNKLIIKYEDRWKIIENIICKMKKDIPENIPITTIGYSFSKSKNSLIDAHLKDIFKNRKVYIVAKDFKESKEIADRLRNEEKIDACDTQFNSFKDYVNHLWIDLHM